MHRKEPEADDNLFTCERHRHAVHKKMHTDKHMASNGVPVFYTHKHTSCKDYPQETKLNKHEFPHVNHCPGE